MDAALMRRIALAMVVMLGGCGSLSDKQHSILGDEHESIFYQKMPGISEFDTISKQDKEDAKWWGNFYGNKPAE